GRGEGGSSADVGGGQRGVRLAGRRRPGQLDMERGDVDQVDLVGPRGQPAGVTARPAADVEDRGRRRGQEAAQELARAFAVQLASALVESVGLVAGGVVGGDRFGLGGVWVYAGGHLSLPMMPALR